MSSAEKELETGGFWEWFHPIGFVISAGWVVWHLPAFILDYFPPSSASDVARVTALHQTKDVLPMAGLFGGRSDIVDWIALLAMPVFFFLGAKTLRAATMEHPDWGVWDRFAMFVGRIVMMLVAGLTIVMLTEVFLRYVLDEPTLWANELTLWTAGFVFLMSGMYAMQQRCHIRITLLYDAVPRWIQRIFDAISLVLFLIFIIVVIYGSYKQIFLIKFLKWEMFGTAFDPPIPATIQPMILIVFTLIGIQAIINFIRDWNKEIAVSEKVDVDEEDIEAMRRMVGEK